MNYYYRRYVAVLLTAFLLAAAAPFALAQETAKAKKVKKAEEQKTEVKKGSYATAQVLCSGLLSKSLLFSPKAAEFCAQHGVTAVSIFPNGSAASIAISSEEQALLDAKEYLAKCEANEKDAEKRVEELRNKIASLEEGPEKEALKKELEKWEQYLKEIGADKEKAAQAVEDAQKKLAELDKLTADDWEKMAGDYKNKYAQMAKDAQEKADSLKKEQDAVQEKIENDQANMEKYKKLYDEAMAAGDDKAAEEYKKLYDEAEWHYQDNTAYADKLGWSIESEEKAAADYQNTADSMNAATAQSMATAEAQAALDKAQNWYQAASDKYDEQYPGLQAAQAAYDNYTSSYTPDEATQAEINKLNAEWRPPRRIWHTPTNKRRLHMLRMLKQRRITITRKAVVLPVAGNQVAVVELVRNSIRPVRKLVRLPTIQINV